MVGTNWIIKPVTNNVARFVCNSVPNLNLKKPNSSIEFMNKIYIKYKYKLQNENQRDERGAEALVELKKEPICHKNQLKIVHLFKL